MKRKENRRSNRRKRGTVKQSKRRTKKKEEKKRGQGKERVMVRTSVKRFTGFKQVVWDS